MLLAVMVQRDGTGDGSSSSGARGRGSTRHDLDPAQNLVITGLPRSGTSFLCAQLNALENTAAINEPDDVFGILLRERSPLARWWCLGQGGGPVDHGRRLAGYYRALRARIAAGDAVPNKIAEDTGLVDEHVPWRPARVTSGDFVLATKNTLLYTCNLAAILSQSFRIVALVRNPRDSITSWQSADPRRMPHLRDGRIPFFERLPRGALGETQRRDYAAIQRETDAVRRLAGLWSFLTRLYIDNRQRLVIVKYEELIADPERALSLVLGSAVRLPSPSPPGRPRTYEITPRDQETIALACRDNARALGYALDANPS
jgi:hypothetical protein